MRRLCLIFWSLLLASGLRAEKHALIIAIGDYPAKTGWKPINSVNDVPLIKGTLLNQGFPESNITVLLNEQATKKGIVDALAKLNSRVKKGDIVVIHYSGHGQQIFDDNGDETDGLDEAIVPHDAFVKYSHNYSGQNHLRDDEIGNIVARFRNKLGKDGQLLWLIDSCHSGTATRGGITRGGEAALIPPDWKAHESDKTKGSGLLEKVKAEPDASPFVLFSGSSANELNYEYNGTGSLTYAFSKALNELGSDFSYRQVFSKISSVMNVICPKQTPTMEGDVDFKLFNNSYVRQQPYFKVENVSPTMNNIRIGAGNLQRIFNKTTVFVVPAGTSGVTEDKILSKGVVINAGFNESLIRLDKTLPDKNQANYWVFTDQPSYGDIAVKVFFESAVEAPVKTGVKGFLTKNGSGEVVTDTLKADILISKQGTAYQLLTAKGGQVLNEVEGLSGEKLVSELNRKLFEFAQGQYLKNLSMADENYQFSFRLLPINYDAEFEEAGELKDENALLSEAGVFTVSPGKDHVVLEVTNKGTKPLYFSIVEINSKGEISPFMPNANCIVSNTERKVEPGKTVLLKSCVYGFAPPYEKLLLKGFASSTPIDLQSTAESRGAQNRSGNNNPLESFLQKSFVQNRSSEGTQVSGKLEGYSAEFVYEIVEE